MGNYARKITLLVSLLVMLSVSFARIVRAEDAAEAASDDVAATEESPEEESEDGVLGAWAGAKTFLSDNGITSEAFLTNDLVSNVHGGVKEGVRLLGSFDLTFTMDTGKANLWENGTFFMYLLGLYGRSPSEIVGDFQYTDNIESPKQFNLLELWYAHSFLDGDLTLTVGQHDYFSVFENLEYAGNLLNSSFTYEPATSQNAISMYPTTTLGVVANAKPIEGTYWLNGLYDGIPGDPNHTRGTHYKFGAHDGLFYATEFGLLPTEEEAKEHYYKLAVGYWYHTAHFEDYYGRARNKNFGFHIMGESSLYSEEDDSEQGLGAFVQAGFADPTRNEIRNYFGGGLSYTGLLPCRDQDITSIGFASALLGGGVTDQDPSLKRAETSIDLSHRIQITPSFAVVPDLQYVANPGAVRGIDDAVVVIVRTEIKL